MRTQSEMGGIFSAIIKGKNLMTPELVRYGQAGPYIYELTTGAGMDRQPIWGVTVVDPRDNSRPAGLSRCCFSLAEVEEYTELLATADGPVSLIPA